MQSIIVRTAAAAFVAAVLAPAAFAQASRAPADNPYLTAGQTPVCTQLELGAGLSGDQCGKLSLTEIVALKMDRDNTN
jgi:hypothetical protein